MDEHSNSVEWFKGDKAEFNKALNFVQTFPTMLTPKKLTDIAANDLKKYAAVFVPGGRTPMNDLMQNPNLGKILQYFHSSSKPTAFLCHGPVASLAALPDPVAYRQALIDNDAAAISKTGSNWIYAGYKMTIFCNAEEKIGEKEQLKGELQFYVADALRHAGGNVEESSKNFAPLVISDRELITGQNPASDYALADALLKILSKTN